MDWALPAMGDANGWFYRKDWFENPELMAEFKEKSGRDLAVQAWYQGGISVVDFTEPERPKEIAYFDRGPIYPNMLVLGGHWSSYWYNNFIYETNITEGLNVFRLSSNATAGAKKFPRLNPQTQVGPVG